MIDYYLTFRVKLNNVKNSNKVVTLSCALKRADYVLNIQDIVSSFFVVILIIKRCRSPPFNLKIKSFELKGDYN